MKEHYLKKKNFIVYNLNMEEITDQCCNLTF